MDSLISVRTRSVGRETHATGVARCAARRAKEPEREAWRIAENIVAGDFRIVLQTTKDGLDEGGEGTEEEGDGIPFEKASGHRSR